jgi:hypothetical protein
MWQIIVFKLFNETASSNKLNATHHQVFVIKTDAMYLILRSSFTDSVSNSERLQSRMTGWQQFMN